MGSGSRKIGKMRSLAIVLLSAVALTRANPCQNDQDVYFPDREDCGRFYMCRNGEMVGHMNCPDGLLWNTDLLTCDWPRNAECTPGCPEGWSSVGDSCYFLSRERVGKFSAAQENEAIVGLAEAARSGNNDGLDYWLGGFELAEVSEVSSEESDEEDEEDEGGEEEDEDVKMGEDEEEEEDEEDKEDEEDDESDSSSQESDHVWQWLSGAPMEYTNWWGEGPDDSGMGKLKGGCIQLLRKGST